MPLTSAQHQALARFLMAHLLQPGATNKPPKQGSPYGNTYESAEVTPYYPSYQRGAQQHRPPEAQEQINWTSTESPTVRGWGGGNGYVIRDFGNNIVGTAPKPVKDLNAYTPDEVIRRVLRAAGTKFVDPYKQGGQGRNTRS